MKIKFRRLAIISLFLVYMVISAGAIVRATGSGMGCPDWPKCFGYYIPPVEQSQLEWQPSNEYSQGQVIIREDSLWVANSDFTSGSTYNHTNWDLYTIHDYAEFNAFHTWTEFINRLFGAMAGFGVFLMALASLRYWKDNKTITLLSWLTVLAMGFQGWLGATVVYSVLEPFKITVHMIMALVIVAMLLYLIFISGPEDRSLKYDGTTSRLIIIVLILTLIQVALGTQVRQFVDDQIELLGHQARALWLADPDLNFYIHRSLSILVVLLNALLAYNIYKKKLGFSKINWALLLIFAEAITGMTMYYAAFPLGTQPIHLLFASLLFGLQFYMVLESRPNFKSS